MKPTAHYANKGNLIDGPVKGHLIRLSFPMIWGIASIISFQLVNTYFISRLGTNELAAITFTFPVTYFIFSFTMGFGIATSSVLSRLIGQGNIEEVRRVTTHSLILVLIVAIIIAASGYFFHDPLFSLLGASPAMIVMIRQYMIIWFIGSVTLTLPLVGNAAIRATGDTYTPAIIMGIAALTNVILDPILIFGFLGLPALGLKGAAIANVITNGSAMIAGLYVLKNHKNLILSLRAMHWEKIGDSCKRILIIALPAGITNSILPIINSVIIGLLSIYGSSAVAAFGIATRIEAFAFITLMALSIGMAPIVGQNWGAKRFERVKETLHLTIFFNILWSGGVAVILSIFAKPIAQSFTNDAEVVKIAQMFFLIVPISYMFGNLMNGWSSAFNAIGKPHFSFLMVIIKLIVLLLPAVYIADKIYHIAGIFCAIAAVNIITGLLFHFLSWRELDKCAHQEAHIAKK